MLNGAYAVGTPDCVSHVAEEIPRPKYNLPLTVAAQMVIGFFTAFFYMIAIFYATTNLDDVLTAPCFPLAQIYAQAKSTNAGTFGLLFIIFVPIFCCRIGTYITAGRCLWTIARDGAVPFSGTLGVISPRFKNPFNATLACGVFSTLLGAIYVGSYTASTHLSAPSSCFLRSPISPPCCLSSSHVVSPDLHNRQDRTPIACVQALTKWVITSVTLSILSVVLHRVLCRHLLLSVFVTGDHRQHELLMLDRGRNFDFCVVLVVGERRQPHRP